MADLLAPGTWLDGDTWNDGATWLDTAPSISGSGGGSTGLDVIFATVPLMPGRTITLSRTDAVPQTWAAPFNPADRAPYVIDLSVFLAGELLDTITDFIVDVVAANMGVTEGTGDRRPIVDRDNKRVAIWPQVDPAFQGPSYFTTPVKARLIPTFTTVGASGSPAETYRRSGYLTIAQVL